MRKPAILTVALLMLALAGALPLAGCGGSMTPAEQIERASQSLDKHNYGDAEVRLKSLLREQGDNARAWFLLARVSLARHRYADATEQLRNAQSNGADADQVAIPLAEALLAQDQYQDALTALDGFNSDDASERANAATLRGRANLGLDKLERADSAFSAALAAVADYAPALVGRAEVARQRKDNARARTLLDRATASSPGYAPAWLAAGMLAYRNQDCGRALPAFEKLLSLDYNGPGGRLFNARAFLTDCQLRAGEIAAARKNIDVLMRQGPDSTFGNYLQSLIDIRDRHYDDASQHLQRVLAGTPDNVRALKLMASVKLAQDDAQSAELYLNQAIARAPADVPTLRLLAALYIKRDENDRAVRMLEDAYDANPDSKGIRALLAQAMAAREGDPGKLRGRSGGQSLVSSDSALRLDVAAAMARNGNTAAAGALLEGFDAGDADARRRAAAVRIAIDLQEKHPDKALTTARKVVSDAPDDIAALALLARTYNAIGESEKAGEALDRALKIDPKNTGLLLARADAYTRGGHYAKAQTTLERVLNSDASNLRAQTAMAGVVAAQSQPEKALSWLEKAQKTHPDNPRVAVRLVQAYLAVQKPAKAVSLATRLVEKDPDSAAFNRVRGIALLGDDKPDAAIDSLEKAASLAPDTPAYRMDLARALVAGGKNQQALDELQKLRREQPKFLPAASALARLQAQMGDGDAALKTINAMPADNNNRAAIEALKGQVLAGQHQYKAAAAAFGNAYQAQPASALALAMFDARRRAGMSDPASPLKDWLKQHPRDTRVTLQLAQWYEASGKKGAAENAYQALLKVDDDNAVALNNLALLRSESDRDGALDYARRAHEAAPGSPAIADTYGWLLVGAGDRARGLPLLRKAANALPEQSDVQYHFASALAATGDAQDRARARKILETITGNDAQFDGREAARALLARLGDAKSGA